MRQEKGILYEMREKVVEKKEMRQEIVSREKRMD